MEFLLSSLEEAENIFRASGREQVKGFLPQIYNALIALNNFDPEFVVNPLAEWNPEGHLTEEEFSTLNRRRKILSNAVGIGIKGGGFRHDLNPDVPESLES